MSDQSTAEAIVVFITASDEEEATRIGSALLDARLVACVNVVREIGSRFWWQGKIDCARESLLIAKTRRDLFPRVLDAVRATHSYEVFEAIAVQIVAGNPDYLRWIEESTAE